MKTITTILLGLVTIFVTTGCMGDGFKKTKSGILYRVISDKKNPVAKNGEFLKVHFTQKVHDSVVTTSVGALPTYARVDSVGNTYSPLEVFGKLRKGDSTIIVMLADSLMKKGQLPPYIKKNDKLTLIIKVLDVLPTETAVRADQQKGIDEIKENEITTIQKYLDSANIKAQKTEKGVFVVVEKPGVAPLADSGKVVKVNYTGTTFQGVVFDSNTDTTFGHAQPYSFTVGQRGAIEGWDDGMRLFGKGGKGRLYIPSILGYGANVPPGAKFKAFENLIFDVEVLDVTVPEKRNPGLPSMDPRARARQKAETPKAGR
ncbi:MAG: FKBP-type peptidyl-prolyl cis-trans isomerase [Chitinophagaceae bacterium]|nr:FKBP-type peptidyl-prolyl cis-trans isomerase [Chitinophagaceae bacterium]